LNATCGEPLALGKEAPIRLLVASLAAYSRYVSREFVSIMRELIGRYGWRHLEPSALMEGPGPLAEGLKRRVGMIPSLILFWEGEDLVSALAPEIEPLCAKWFFVEDLHHRGQREARTNAALLCDTVLASYAYRFLEFFPPPPV
jgi:hypothetical protein